MGIDDREKNRENKARQDAIKKMISTTDQDQVEIIENKKKGRPKSNRETKKRITFTILPSLYDDASKISYIDGKSVSEIVGDLLADYVKKNKDKLNR